MNKFILCVMDKRKTVEEIENNYDAATAAYAAAYATTVYAADAADAAYFAAYAAAYDPCDLWYYLNKYFTLTGEDREAYQKEADK